MDKLDIEKVKETLAREHVSDSMLNVLVGQIERDGLKKTEKYYTKRYKDVEKEANSDTDSRCRTFGEILSIIGQLHQNERLA